MTRDSWERVSEHLGRVPEGAIDGIKVETEGEGAPWSRVHALLRFSGRFGLPMTLKIGGPDARTDLSLASELGLDGVTAPLVESAFAVHKFRAALEVTFGQGIPNERNILVESSQGLANYDKIILDASDFATGINFGRSDLRMSLAMMDQNVPFVDDVAFLDLLTEPARAARKMGFTVTMGGNVSAKTILKVNSHEVGSFLSRIETRRFVLRWDVVRENQEILREVLGIEEVLSSSELKFLTSISAREAKRLAELRTRLASP